MEESENKPRFNRVPLNAGLYITEYKNTEDDGWDNTNPEPWDGWGR